MNELKKQYEGYYEIITEYVNKNEAKDDEYKVVKSKDGSINLKIKKDNTEIYLHSSYSVKNENIRWMSNIGNDEKIYIVFGGGFFYHVEELLNSRPNVNNTFIVIENDINIFVKAMENINMVKLLKDIRVILLLSDNPDEIAETIFHIMKKKGIQSTEVCTLMSYQEIYKDWLKITNKAIVQMLKLFGMNIATELYFSEQWIYNQFQNIKAFNVKSFPLDSLYNEFKDIPAIVVGAGPSLGKQIETLKKNYNKALIFCAGSSINVLQKNDITPHFEVVVDGGETESKIIGNIGDVNVTLLTLATVHSDALKKYNGRQMWFRGNSYSAVDYFEKYVGLNSERIELGPSCVNMAVDIAKKLGCYPIMLIGQDMAFTNDRFYSEGPEHNKDLKDITQTKVLTKDIYGKEVYTIHSLLGIKDYFEIYVRTNNLKGRMINCTEGGLGVEGIENKKFNEIIEELPDLEFNINDKIEYIYECNKKKVQNEISYKTNEFIKHIQELTIEVEKQSNKRVNIINDILNKFDNLTIEQIKKHVNKVTKLTDEIEINELHKEVMRYNIAAYSISIKNNVHSELEKNTNIKMKYKLLLEGLKKEYVYYNQVLQVLKASVTEEN